MADEETRAAAWRQSVANRAVYTANRVKQLQGDPVAHAAFVARWQPILTLGDQEASDGDLDPNA